MAVDPHAALCPYCGARGCPLAAIPQVHRPKRRGWLKRLLGRT